MVIKSKYIEFNIHCKGGQFAKPWCIVGKNINGETEQISPNYSTQAYAYRFAYVNNLRLS